MNLIDRSLAFRKELRRFYWGWVCPKKLELEQARATLNEALKGRWPGINDAEVYELIYDSKAGDPEVQQCVVFIDVEFDVDWLCLKELEDESNTLVAQAAAVGARRCGHLPQEQVLEFKRLVGQAVLSGIRGLKGTAQKLTKEASEFLKERTVERSRYWTLNSAHALALMFGGALFYVSRALHFSASAPDVPFGLWVGAVGGLTGAFLSVILKAGSGEWDAASGIKIHCIEVLTKFLAGMVSGCVVFILTRSAHAPPSLAAIAPDSYSLLVVAVATGLIERFIPKVVTKYSDKIAKAD